MNYRIEDCEYMRCFKIIFVEDVFWDAYKFQKRSMTISDLGEDYSDRIFRSIIETNGVTGIEINYRDSIHCEAIVNLGPYFVKEDVMKRAELAIIEHSEIRYYIADSTNTNLRLEFSGRIASKACRTYGISFPIHEPYNDASEIIRTIFGVSYGVIAVTIHPYSLDISFGCSYDPKGIKKQIYVELEKYFKKYMVKLIRIEPISH